MFDQSTLFRRIRASDAFTTFVVCTAIFSVRVLVVVKFPMLNHDVGYIYI